MDYSDGQREKIETVLTFQGIQVTGITMDATGRMFVNFPRWRNGVRYSVVEVLGDGSHRPYPDTAANCWENGDRPDPHKFVCVQSVIAHGGMLYVLDTKNPSMKEIVAVPTIYVYDLATDTLARTYELAESVHSNSYTNDLRVDDAAGKIYLTDPGAAGLIVVDLESGENNRILDGHPFTTAEFGRFMPGGKPYEGTIHSDGIALDRRNGILYFHALMGYTLYGIPTDQLVSRRIDETRIFRMKTPAPDGMVMDRQGRLYMGDLEKNAVVYLTPGCGEIRTLARGGGISWPDTFTIYNEFLYFTNSRIHEASGDISNMQFTVDKIKLPQ